jgi:hypothetical protein
MNTSATVESPQDAASPAAAAAVSTFSFLTPSDNTEGEIMMGGVSAAAAAAAAAVPHTALRRHRALGFGFGFVQQMMTTPTPTKETSIVPAATTPAASATISSPSGGASGFGLFSPTPASSTTNDTVSVTELTKRKFQTSQEMKSRSSPSSCQSESDQSESDYGRLGWLGFLK